MRWQTKVLVAVFAAAFMLSCTGTARAATNVNNCTVLNAAGETYVLTQAIPNSANTTCFNITASNMVFDCNYHLVDGIDTGNTNGIYAKAVTNVTIRNCNLTDWAYGVYFDAAQNSTVYRNNFTSNNDGIELMHSRYVNISSNRIESVNDAIYASNTSYSTLAHNDLVNNELGISFYATSRNNTMSGGSIINTTSDGIYVYQSYDNLFRDIYMSTASQNIYQFASSDTVFLNVSADASKITVDAGTVYIKWYADILVLSGDDASINSANVTGRDRYNMTVFSGITNSTGQLARQNLTEFHQNFTGKFYYSNYTVNASAFTFYANQTSANITGNRLVTVRLYGLSQPSVTVRTYTSALAETYMFKPGRLVRVRAHVTYGFGREYIFNATVIIKDSSGTEKILGEPMVNVGNITDGYIYEYNYTLPGTADGLWTINVTSSDAFSGKGFGLNKIAVLPVTLQIKLVLNSTPDSIYVPGTGETPFASLVTDEYALPDHYYIASSSNDALKAVVFAQLSPISVFTEKGASDYAMGASQRYASSLAFLVFSKGRWTTVNNRIAAVEKNEFLLSPEPSFGFGLGTAYRMKVIIENSMINLNKTVAVPKGYSTMIIEKKGTVGGKANIEIRRG